MGKPASWVLLYSFLPNFVCFSCCLRILQFGSPSQWLPFEPWRLGVYLHHGRQASGEARFAQMAGPPARDFFGKHKLLQLCVKKRFPNMLLRSLFSMFNHRNFCFRLRAHRPLGCSKIKRTVGPLVADPRKAVNRLLEGESPGSLFSACLGWLSGSEFLGFLWWNPLVWGNFEWISNLTFQSASRYLHEFANVSTIWKFNGSRMYKRYIFP